MLKRHVKVLALGMSIFALGGQAYATPVRKLASGQYEEKVGGSKPPQGYVNEAFPEAHALSVVDSPVQANGQFTRVVVLENPLDRQLLRITEVRLRLANGAETLLKSETVSADRIWAQLKPGIDSMLVRETLSQLNLAVELVRPMSGYLVLKLPRFKAVEVGALEDLSKKLLENPNITESGLNLATGG